MIYNCNSSGDAPPGDCIHGTRQCCVHLERGEHATIDEALAPFVQDMRGKLLENAYKGGWERDPAHLLMARVYEEVAELTEALDPDPKAHDSFMIAAHHLRCASQVLRMWGPLLVCNGKASTIVKEAADVANMVMMIADNAKNGRLGGT